MREVGGPNEIAEALIRLGVVGREQFEAEMQRVRAEGQATAASVGGQLPGAFDNAARGSNRLGGGLRTLRRSLNDSIGLFTSLIGRVAAVGAVFTVFYNIGERVSDMLFRNTEAADAYANAMKGAEESAKRVAEFREQSVAGAEPEDFAAIGAPREFVERARADLAAAEAEIAKATPEEIRAARVGRTIALGQGGSINVPDEGPLASALRERARLAPIVERQTTSLKRSIEERQENERVVQQLEQINSKLGKSY